MCFLKYQISIFGCKIETLILFKMSENMPEPNETSDPQSSYVHDIIDLTDIADECEVSTSSVIVPNYSVNFTQPGSRPAGNNRSSNSSEDNRFKQLPDPVDDSISILYEHVQPQPDIVFVNEVVVDGSEESEPVNEVVIDPSGENESVNEVVDGSRENESVNKVVADGSRENESADNDSTFRFNPLLFSGYSAEQLFEFSEIPPLFPEIISENISSSSLPIGHSFDVQHSSLSSNYPTMHQGSYLSTIHQGSYPSTVDQGSYPSTVHQESYPSTIHQGSYSSIYNAASSSLAVQRHPWAPITTPLSSLPGNIPSRNLQSEKSKVDNKVYKIQCGICLEGPDEIAASDKNFVSTNCGHVFCNECLKISLKSAAKCPKCRKRITSRQYHNLYL